MNLCHFSHFCFFSLVSLTFIWCSKYTRILPWISLNYNFVIYLTTLFIFLQSLLTDGWLLSTFQIPSTRCRMKQSPETWQALKLLTAHSGQRGRPPSTSIALDARPVSQQSGRLCMPWLQAIKELCPEMSAGQAGACEDGSGRSGQGRDLQECSRGPRLPASARCNRPPPEGASQSRTAPTHHALHPPLVCRKTLASDSKEWI